ELDKRKRQRSEEAGSRGGPPIADAPAPAISMWGFHEPFHELWEICRDGETFLDVNGLMLCESPSLLAPDSRSPCGPSRLKLTFPSRPLSVKPGPRATSPLVAFPSFSRGL